MRALSILLAVTLTACATSYRPIAGAEGPFAFALTPQQCAELKKEQRSYHATQSASVYLGGAGALVSAIALAVGGTKAVPAAGAGVSLLAGGAGAFTGAQVSDLDAELTAGGCPR
jgi:hypothetical protein